MQLLGWSAAIFEISIFSKNPSVGGGMGLSHHLVTIQVLTHGVPRSGPQNP